MRNSLEKFALEQCSRRTGVSFARREFAATVYMAVVNSVGGDDQAHDIACEWGHWPDAFDGIDRDATPEEWRASFLSAERELQCELGSVIPDGYVIDPPFVIILEIIDRNPLSEEKIVKLAALFWMLDLFRWSLSVFTTDRYGQNLEHFNLLGRARAIHEHQSATEGEP